MPPRDSTSRHSPIASLASLEYLQTQRRGSITDPSLHAASNINPGIKLNTNYRHPSDQQPSPSSVTSSTYQDTNSKPHMSDPRPSSPFVFGDATPHSTEHTSQLRKLLHSPSSEHRPATTLSHDLPDMHRSYSGLKDANQMNVDHDTRHSHINRRNIRDPPSFDFTMRRHSIAVGQNPITLPHLSSTLGTKRKMSVDRGIFAPVGEDVDPQLVGPGVPSMNVDSDAPASKRRGSAIDTQRIAQLSLNDRRNSVDSRNWLLNDRRDSAPSLFPPVPGINTFNSTFNPPDPQQSRLPSSMSAFSWPANQHLSESPNSLSQNESTHMNHRPYESTNHASVVPPPPLSFPPDRRMSVPDNLTNPMPSRNLRSRSRPPSRQNTDPNTHSGPSSGQEESNASPPATGSKKEGGMTPYSRSPELRVSHKLAERKRRKEMKDLFDELRDQLPADRGMKASKWEILSKAIDFVSQLKRSHQEALQELESLRQQVDTTRSQGGAPNHPNYNPPGNSGYQPVSSNMGPFPPPSLPPITTHSPHDSRSNSVSNHFASPPNGHRSDNNPT